MTDDHDRDTMNLELSADRWIDGLESGNAEAYYEALFETIAYHSDISDRLRDLLLYRLEQQRVATQTEQQKRRELAQSVFWAVYWSGHGFKKAKAIVAEKLGISPRHVQTLWYEHMKRDPFARPMLLAANRWRRQAAKRRAKKLGHRRKDRWPWGSKCNYKWRL